MHYFSFIAARSDTGAALPYAQVTVYITGTQTKVTLYDINGSLTTNPVAADSYGLVGFSCVNGTYDIKITSVDGILSLPLWPQVQIVDTLTTYNAVTALVAGGTSGSILLFSTLSTLNADLIHAAGSTALVYQDSTVANNGFYIKSGASGTGSWVNSGLGIPLASINSEVSRATTAEASLQAQITELQNPLKINSFSVATPIVQAGSTVTSVLNWSLTKDGTSQSIDQGVGSVTPLTLRTKSVTGVTADTTWTLSVANALSGTLTKTASVSFQNKRYYGASASTSLNNAAVLALTSEYDTDYNRSGMTFNCSGGKYPYICWPATFGAPSSITVGGLSFNDFTITTQNVTTETGIVVSYNVLRFNQLQNGSNIQVTI